MPKPTRYIPALSFRWLTPLYDPILKWVMSEEVFKRKLVRRANIQPGMKVLDLGCGTGTLRVMLKQAYPNANITGMDGDPQVLAIAREKSRGMEIQCEEGLLPLSRTWMLHSTVSSPVWSFTTSSPTISAAPFKRFIAFSNRAASYTSLTLARRTRC